MSEISFLGKEDLDVLTDLHEEVFGQQIDLYDFFNNNSYVILGHRGSSYLIVKHIIDEGEIIFIGVAKNHRREGLASELLEKYFETYNDEMFLDVREDNLSAIRLYEKFGFQEIYRREAYYGDGADAIVMRREKDENFGNRDKL